MTPFPIFQLFKNNNNFKAANALFFVFDLTVGHCKLTFGSSIYLRHNEIVQTLNYSVQQ